MNTKNPNSIASIRLEEDFNGLGISPGDTLLIRAGLRQVGKISRDAFLDALLNVIGNKGTLVSLAFTKSVYLWNADKAEPFTTTSTSYAGALPNAMISYPGSCRSRHPTCSFVAIGLNAKYITDGHGPDSNAYEPVRRIIELGGKCVLVGCVSDSPGFTTAHLAEYDLGLHRRVVFPNIFGVAPYLDDYGKRKLFCRKDPGLCSNSYWKFYAHYVKNGILHSGFIGNAYSIAADARESYKIEKGLLSKDANFTVCDNPMCATCNLLRWDRLHKIPGWAIRRIYKKLRGS